MNGPQMSRAEAERLTRDVRRSMKEIHARLADVAGTEAADRFQADAWKWAEGLPEHGGTLAPPDPADYL